MLLLSIEYPGHLAQDKEAQGTRQVTWGASGIDQEPVFYITVHIFHLPCTYYKYRCTLAFAELICVCFLVAVMILLGSFYPTTLPSTLHLSLL